MAQGSTTPNINNAQVAGVATATGNGTTSTGTQRVTLASDSTGQVLIASPAFTTTGDIGAKTVTFNGFATVNPNAKGMYCHIIFGTVSGTSPTCAIQLQFTIDGTTYINIGAASTAITATGNSVLFVVYPSNISQAAGSAPAVLTSGATQTVAINAPLPKQFRFVYTIGGTTPSFALTAANITYISA